MDLDIHFKNTLPLLRAGKLQINITKINYTYTYKNSHLPYFVIVTVVSPLESAACIYLKNQEGLVLEWAM